MTSPRFVYVSFMRTTPDALWHALTDSDFTKEYWDGAVAQSDWKVGSPLTLSKDGKELVQGKILVADKPTTLSYSWNTVMSDEMKKEGFSRVTFQIDQSKDQVKLTVTHDEFPENSVVFGSISGGWPKVISNLKSVLESLALAKV